MSTKNTKLELTWIGKENRPKLEARILLEDPDLSYHAPHKVTDQDIFDNKLIFGDNLLALKALEQEYAGKVKCVYIDPPFNTGDMFENYDDGLEHSIWLGQMRDRLEIIRNLLQTDGSIFIHLNDDELDYCKVICDELFGRKNFVNRITISARSASAFSTVNPGVFKASEYLLWYAKDKTYFTEKSGRVKREPDYAYNKWLVNPEAPIEEWTLIPLMEAYESHPPSKSKRPDSLLKHFHDFIINNARQVCRFASISDSGAGEQILELKKESLNHPGVFFQLERGKNLDDVFIIDGQQLIFYEKNVSAIDGELSATAIMTNIWNDIQWEGIAKEGNVTFRKGKKPEKLLKRVFDLTTNPGDLVLDSFGGSGTTGAVAHKMGRRWIMVELGEHCHTHIIPRMKQVIDGTDQGGISKTVNWKGGGGFRYYKLAPSLMEKDQWGNWVISQEYNAPMLAEALCKLEGFRYDPDPNVFWIHGRSTEKDFLYATTAHLQAGELNELNEAVGNDQSLLVLCTAFEGNENRWPNLLIKKIPAAVMQKCEWGKDDYSLKVANLPDAPIEDGTQLGLF